MRTLVYKVTGQQKLHGTMFANSRERRLQYYVFCSLFQWHGTIIAHGLMSFEPVSHDNGSAYCAVDVPTTVFPVSDIVGIPDAVPDAVRCGYACTGFVNCTSYNHKIGITTASNFNSWDSVCELFTFTPHNCTTLLRSTNCVHYQVGEPFLDLDQFLKRSFWRC